MNAEEVLDVLRSLDSLGIEVWVEGGWGVDALVGRQLRAHKDLDLVVRLSDSQRLLSFLESRGFSLIAGAAPAGFLCRDEAGRAVDVRAVAFASDGSAAYRQQGREEWTYPPGSFEGRGTIAGVPVRCLTPTAQMLTHTGYEHAEKDIQEMRTLHETFGVPIPEHDSNDERPSA